MKIFIVPGNYGGLNFEQMSSKNQRKRAWILHFLDTISLPWATRLAHAGAVAIMGVKEFMPMSIFPNSKKISRINEIG